MNFIHYCQPICSLIRYCQLISVCYPLSPTQQKPKWKTLMPNPIAREIWAHNSFWVERKSNLKFEIWSQFDSQISILGVDPPVDPTFWRGCRGSTSTNDPANESINETHSQNGFKNIGLGGVPASNRALNSIESVCISVYMYINTTDVTFSKKRIATLWPQCGFAAKTLGKAGNAFNY